MLHCVPRLNSAVTDALSQNPFYHRFVNLLHHHHHTQVLQSLSSLIRIGNGIWLVVHCCGIDYTLTYSTTIAFQSLFLTRAPQAQAKMFLLQRNKRPVAKLSTALVIDSPALWSTQLNTIWPGYESSKIPATVLCIGTSNFETLENFLHKIKSWKLHTWAWHRFCQMHIFKVVTCCICQRERCQFCLVSKTATSSPSTGSCCLTKFPKLRLFIPDPAPMNGERTRFVNLFD